MAMTSFSLSFLAAASQAAAIALAASMVSAVLVASMLFSRKISERDAERFSPGEAFVGAGARLVFAARPARVAELFQRREDRAIGYLALVGLGPARHRGDLHMADAGQMPFEPLRHVALADADMVDVEHDLDVRCADLSDDVGGLVDGGIEIVRLVALV